MDFYLLQKKFGTKYGKKFVNKGITAAKRFNKSKYGKALKKRRIKVCQDIRQTNFRKNCTSSW